MLRTSSLQKLRTARICSAQEAFAVLALGQSLAAFELLTNCTGSMLILRYSLGITKEWYLELAREETMDPIMITPVFWDTVSCLMKGEVPIVRFLERDRVVDKVAGICTGLLPMFYDLCVVARKIKCRNGSASDMETSDLKAIECRIRSWTPEPPLHFIVSFSPSELLALETQASMYRTASLLLIHRLSNPIGTQDSIALALANTIMLNFFKFVSHIGPDVKVPYVTFPILLASLEIGNLEADVWESMALLMLAPVCAAKILACVEHVWEKRRQGFSGFLWELTDTGPEFVIVP